jgi:hypothetical protein
MNPVPQQHVRATMLVMPSTIEAIAMPLVRGGYAGSMGGVD